MNKNFIKQFFVATSVIIIVIFFSVVVSAQVNHPPAVQDVFVNNYAFNYSDFYSVSTPIAPAVGATKNIYVNGRVFDEDGVGTSYEDGDINTIELQFYRSNIGANCTPDPNDCYRVYCSVTPNSGTVLNYSCLVELSYIADSTMTGGTHESEVWNAEVVAKDDAQSVDSTIKEIEINTILALLIPQTLDFGTLTRAQATTSQNNVEYALVQQGNDTASVEVSGSSMTCSINGSIPLGDIQWSLSDVGAGDVLSNALTSSPINTGLSVGTDDDVGLSKSLYWNIVMPDVVSGLCSGTSVISATPF